LVKNKDYQEETLRPTYANCENLTQQETLPVKAEQWKKKWQNIVNIEVLTGKRMLVLERD